MLHLADQAQVTGSVLAVTQHCSCPRGEKGPNAVDRPLFSSETGTAL